MDISHLLSIWFGFYLVVTGLFMLIRRNLIKKSCTECTSSPYLSIMRASSYLFISALVLTIHPVFQFNFAGFITLVLGIVPALRGLWGYFVAKYSKKSESKHHSCPITMGVISLVVGLILVLWAFLTPSICAII